MSKARDLSLGLAITVYGILLGGIVYSHLVYFPPYLSALPKSATALVHGPYALHDEDFWINLHPVLILSLIAALVLNWRVKARRKLIAIPMVIYAVAIVATVFYFVPELIAFRNSPSSTVTSAEWLVRAHRWMHLSLTRGALMLVAFIPLLMAMRRPPE